MLSDDSDGPKQRLVTRAFRWQPDNLIQVWLAATATGLIIFAVDWVISGRPLPGLIFAMIFAGTFGAVHTHRLP
jgi:lipid-binding SYLF domain-containing protein